MMGAATWVAGGSTKNEASHCRPRFLEADLWGLGCVAWNQFFRPRYAFRVQIAKPNHDLGSVSERLFEKATLNAAQKSVRAAIEEFKCLILAKLAEQIESAHSRAQNWAIAARDPAICGGQWADKR